MTVEQLAAALNMTTRTLNRKMKLLVQERPKDFITRVRKFQKASFNKAPLRFELLMDALNFHLRMVFRAVADLNGINS